MEHEFPCGDLALDFAGTLQARRNAAPAEMLTSPERLASWFSESGVVDGDIECTPLDVEDALALREAIYSLVAAKMADESYDGKALSLVNHAARTPSAIPELTALGRRILATPEQAMSSVARNAVDVLGGADAALLKECMNPECTQVYIDRSRGTRREWCAMDSCGNKMKAAAYRARKKRNQSTTVTG